MRNDPKSNFFFQIFSLIQGSDERSKAFRPWGNQGVQLSSVSLSRAGSFISICEPVIAL